MRRFTALLAVLLLAACASKGEPDSLCPKTGFINGADKVTLFGPNGKDIALKATINGFNGDCALKDKKKKDGVVMTLNVPFWAQRGPAGGGMKDKELPYFIAVLSPDEDILQRTAFTTNISFDNNGVGDSTEEHQLTIPMPSIANADKYKVIIGFSLTPEQLKYNEEQK